MKPTDTTDLYEVLGVPPDVDQQGLRDAFRRATFRWHPDQGPPAEASQRAQVTRLLLRAFEVLRQPERRAGYDQARREGKTPADFFAHERAALEAAAEAQAREAGVARRQALAQRVLGRLTATFPDPSWREVEERDPFFQAEVHASPPLKDYRFMVRCAERLGPEDLPGLFEYALARAAEPARGLRTRQDLYLLIAEQRRDMPALQRQLADFHEAAYLGDQGRSGRVLIALWNADLKGKPRTPGVAEPDPDVRLLGIEAAPSEGAAGLRAENRGWRSRGARTLGGRAWAKDPADPQGTARGRGRAPAPPVPVWVIDEDAGDLRRAKKALAGAGISCRAELLTAQLIVSPPHPPPALVVLDPFAGEGKAEELARRLATSSAVIPTAVLYWSDAEADRLREAAARLEGAGWLEKGPDVAPLVFAVRGALGASGRKHAKRQDPARSGP